MACGNDGKMKIVVGQIVLVLRVVGGLHRIHALFHTLVVFFRCGFAGQADGVDFHSLAEQEEIPVRLLTQDKFLIGGREIGRVGRIGPYPLPGDDQLLAPQLLQCLADHHTADREFPA